MGRVTLCLLLLSLGACAPSAAEATPEDEATTRITPFLTFQESNAEEAMLFYVSLFEDGRVVSTERYEAGGPAPEGTVKVATFEIAGQHVRCSDSPMKHEWDFTPGVSLFVDCTSTEQLESLVVALQEGGNVLMPPGDYGFSKRFAWVEDRYGVSWQINLPGD